MRARADVPAGRLLFALSNAAPPETWAEDVEAWIALSPDGGDPVFLGRWTLARATEPQVFAFAPARVAWVRERVLSNQGGADSSSLAEVALLPATGPSPG